MCLHAWFTVRHAVHDAIRIHVRRLPAAVPPLVGDVPLMTSMEDIFASYTNMHVTTANRLLHSVPSLMVYAAAVWAVAWWEILACIIAMEATIVWVQPAGHTLEGNSIETLAASRAIKRRSALTRVLKANTYPLVWAVDLCDCVVHHARAKKKKW